MIVHDGQVNRQDVLKQTSNRKKRGAELEEEREGRLKGVRSSYRIISDRHDIIVRTGILNLADEHGEDARARTLGLGISFGCVHIGREKMT